VQLYHFVHRDACTSILNQGLHPVSRFKTLGSTLRTNVVFALLHPAQDAMGYARDAAYICLALTVEDQPCYVASMDIISAAYVKSLQHSAESLQCQQQLVKHYDESAVAAQHYEQGYFRAPEVLIQGSIAPHHIRPFASGWDADFNRASYNRRLNALLQQFLPDDSPLDLIDQISLLQSHRVFHPIALHDDATGLLLTGSLSDVSLPITIELGQQKPKEMLSLFV
jgi:hypothetical protein